MPFPSLKKEIESFKETVNTLLLKGYSGLDVASFLSDKIDKFIHRQADKIFLSDTPITVLAVGGYGKGLLAPYSDIDLLIIIPCGLDDEAKQKIQGFLCDLWDSGLKVGSRVMTVKEAIQTSLDDMVTRSTFFHLRTLWGNPVFARRFKNVLWKKSFSRNTELFVEAKLQEREKRLRKAGDSRYLVEPNIKEGKGGLRDLDTLLWLGYSVFQIEDPKDFIKKGIFTRKDYALFNKASRFLWSVRCHLHSLSGRAEERLSFDVQPDIANRLGYGSRKGHLAVERFMKHYFLVARDIGSLTRLVCSKLEAHHLKTSSIPSSHFWEILPDFMQRPKSLQNEADFYILHKRLIFNNKEALKNNPLLLLKIFWIADSQGCDIHPHAFRWIEEELFTVKSLCHDKEANALFRKILCHSQNLEQTLTRMSEAGVLGRFIPDFGRIVAMMQFNRYHHYTADEHLIRCMGILWEIDHQKRTDEFPLSSKIIKTIACKDVLYLALFLHDIAKGRPEDHSIVGSQIAKQLAPALGFSPSETEDVAWLVEHHLVMSETAQRRDLSDDKAIENFASFVQTSDRLKMLLCLTVADICGVGKGVMTHWKSSLLGQLYTKTQTLLQGVILEKKHQHQSLLYKQNLVWNNDTFQSFNCESQQQIRHILEGFLESYWLCMPEETHLYHACCLNTILALPEENRYPLFIIRPLLKNGVSEISIYMPDEPSLFCKIAAAFALSKLNIVDAKVFTSREGLILNTFWFQDLSGHPVTEDFQLERLKAKLLQIFASPHLSLIKQSDKKKNLFSIIPSVRIDNDASDTYTVLEVTAEDRIGLLYLLTFALNKMSMSIHTALISTYGEKAVDVFYIKDRYGLKISSSVKQKRIEETIIEILSL